SRPRSRLDRSNSPYRLLYVASDFLLDRFRYGSGYLLQQDAHFFSLHPQFAELPPPVCCLHFQSVSEVLRREKSRREIKAATDVAVRNVDDFMVERHCPLPSRVERTFPALECLLEGVCGLLIERAGLSDGPFD